MNEPSHGTLTDDDIARLTAAMDRSWERRKAEIKTMMSQEFESIGYDVSTPESRNAIRINHDFLDGFRKGSGKVKMAAVGMLALAVFAELGRWMVAGLFDAVRAALSAKGAG